MLSKYFPATSATKASCSLIDDKNRPIVFVGGITVSDTDDRDNPPAPICGLNLNKTALGNGHIMALQLGGPDDSANIVPQYQQWQQVGRWRSLEKNAMLHAAAGSWIFVAHMTYAHDNDHWDALCVEFRKGRTTIFWNDFRIPTVFDIWLLDAASEQGKYVSQKILAPTATSRQADAAGLPLKLTVNPKFQSNKDQATEMPFEDRNYWRKNELAFAVEGLFEEYQEDYASQSETARTLMDTHKIGKEKEREEMASVLMSPKHETEYDFVGSYGDTIRKELGQFGWLGAEVVEYGTNAKMLEAVFHVKTLTGQQKKNQASYVEGYQIRKLSSKAPRLSFSERYHPYKRMGETFQQGLKGDRFQPEGEEGYEARLDRFTDGMAKDK